MKNPWMYLLLFCFLLVKVKLHAQNIQTIANSPNLQTADSLFKLAEKYDSVGDSKRAQPLFESSLPIYQKLGKQREVGHCFNYIGANYYRQGNLSKALSFFEKGVAAYKKAGYKKGVAALLNNVGVIYYSMGNYPQAVELYKQTIFMQEKIGNKNTTATITGNIGGIYSKIKDYPNALKYLNKADALFKELNDKRGVAKILMEVGYISMEQGNFDKALKEFDESLNIAQKAKEKEVEIEVLSNLGELFYRKSDFQKALFYYNSCLKKAEEIGKLQYRSSCSIAIGNIFYQLKKYNEAVGKCSAGLTIAEKMGAISIKKDACECLYHAYKSLNNNSLALLYYEKVNAFEDSLNTKEASSRMMNMEFQKQQLVDSIAFVKKQSAAKLKHQVEIQAKEKQRNIIIASLGMVLLIAGGLWYRLNFVRKAKETLKVEKDRSEALLLNILPQEIAEELKLTGSVKAKDFGMVSILFTDFQSFTQTAQTMSPQRLVEEINVCFEAFDRISEKYQIEKIKTIGDAYMAAGGMANADENSPQNVVLAALEMQAFIAQRAIENQLAPKPHFEMRLGIHAGPIVAGVVGVKKFQYDIWGDTVNTASRMESNGSVGKVNISEAFYELIKDDPLFSFEYRGNISAKGKGEIKMYFVEKNALMQM
ncbi:tetratricopeptide repeat protein [Runella sp. CRIBMP]|uniref:adenylate/guanylate cyclase domain-containing protein n=1 Tax=Runella sp. CRIBMP TaxID=2683261 RepID=UPI001412F48E|nr:adenylate/guanylate cyclase domain-containing protein [Runella sp. CRIBMP]NBB21238.1 tetratricopeptide repeat protein [Runella sp. CRIBMP]